jgi:4-hydroxybenzoate polyprenyltransferase
MIDWYKKNDPMWVVVVMICAVSNMILFHPNFIGFWIFVIAGISCIVIRNTKISRSKDGHSEASFRQSILLLGMLISVINIMLNDNGNRYIIDLHNAISNNIVQVNTK